MKKRPLLLLILFASVCLTSCLREGIDTIALPFGKIPDGVIPAEIREQFEQYIPIYEGITPPNITGEYLVSPDVLVFTSDGNFDPGYQFADMYIQFYDQTPSGICKYRHRQSLSTADAPEVYVVGRDNNFTAYFIEDEIRFDDNGDTLAYCKISKIVSGTWTEHGIENYRNGFIMLEKYDPTDLLMDVNVFRVVEDGNGFSENYNWVKSYSKDDANLPTCIDKKPALK